MRFLTIFLISLTLSQPLYGDESPADTNETVRFAIFNTALNRQAPGHLLHDLQQGRNRQIEQIAEVIQRIRPDVLVLQEFDFEPEGQAISCLRSNYLERSQGKQEPIDYPYSFCQPVNTGIDTGFDLDSDGMTGGSGDCQGFGGFEGQYGMLILSRLPIDEDSVRTFRSFLWKDMPNAVFPVDPETGEDFYTQEEIDILRLSSKSHWDVPIRIGAQTIHILTCHPTPPVFDGPEDRNGRRNHDEIRFWADYVTPEKSGYIYDDRDQKGGLADGTSFVILGDLNADPVDGDSYAGAVNQLLDHPSINSSLTPESTGATEQTGWNSAMDRHQAGNLAHDTASFKGGNLRADYILPSKDLKPAASGVFWPGLNEDGYKLLKVSDHRLVWMDIELSR